MSITTHSHVLCSDGDRISDGNRISGQNIGLVKELQHRILCGDRTEQQDRIWDLVMGFGGRQSIRQSIGWQASEYRVLLDLPGECFWPLWTN